MNECVTAFDLVLAIFGCVFFSSALHFRKQDKGLKFSLGLGLAENLTVFGRVQLFVGIALLALVFLL